jgi:nucleotide-binding universal stress UspA family protein
VTAVSHRLRSSLEGALAGGGDPASSPLYVFGPFLSLIVAAGVGAVTFGASVWLVVLTIGMVSAMYRLVMSWVTDGSGGSGLSEEEFGSPAVKLNAGITFVEYSLTFAVSIAALVTFLADRLPVLEERILGLQWGVLVALGFSVLTGWIVNRGPRAAARAFGPATAGVLILLWVMVVATVLKFGLRFPTLELDAFRSDNLGYTLGGYARILAVMTGIEVFANLVPAYGGTRRNQARKAFGSLLIIMATTSVAMLIVGPAIFALSDPTDAEVSVFTQTMDRLLPAPIAVAGTVAGIAVLLSAAAASALGLQNLFAGLKIRHYLPPLLGRPNRHGVAGRAVWLEVAIVSACFLTLGTDEETYLALYAAGVFILLSMTGWAATKRLGRSLRTAAGWRVGALLTGTGIAAVLTTGATVIVFLERFTSGVWLYAIILPALFLLLGYFRQRLGPPTAVEERVGTIVERGQMATIPEVIQRLEEERTSARILVPLDGSELAERAVSVASALARPFHESVILLTVGEDNQALRPPADRLAAEGVPAATEVVTGPVAEAICRFAHEQDVGLIVMSTQGRTGARRRIMGSVAERVVRKAQRPVLIVPRRAQMSVRPSFDRVIVSLDGSSEAERVLPFVSSFARRFGAPVVLLHVFDEGSEALDPMERYLAREAERLAKEQVEAEVRTVAGDPAEAIVGALERERQGLLMIATHGRGGVERLLLGSVAQSVIRRAGAPVLLVPILERRDSALVRQ